MNADSKGSRSMSVSLLPNFPSKAFTNIGAHYPLKIDHVAARYRFDQCDRDRIHRDLGGSRCLKH